MSNPTTTGWCTPAMRCNLDGCPICGAIKSNNPTTTGEWTAECVMLMFLTGDGGQGRASESYKAIADAHNAALAEATDAAVQEMLLVNQQLAAERNAGWNEGREHERKCNDAALAAERERQGVTLAASTISDICANRHKGNEQSTAAFHVIKDKISARQLEVYHAIRFFNDGVTVDELAVTFKTTPNAISGRVSELKRMGKIYKSGTRKTRSGCSAAILKAF